MPNWCYNKLEIPCNFAQSENLRPKLFSQTNEGTWYLDFERLIPMPKTLDIQSSGDGCRALGLLKISPYKRFSNSLIKQYISSTEQARIGWKTRYHRWTVSDFIKWLSKRPNEQKRLHLDISLGLQLLDNIALYEYQDWYDWSNARWGCKWNVNPDSCRVTFYKNGSIDCFFDTPWNQPSAWFEQLCQAFPDIEFLLSYYEPGEWFAGEYVANLEGGYYEQYVEDWEIRAFAEDVFGEEFDEEDDPIIRL